MTHHSAFGLDLDALDIVIIDESKPMQGLLRSMLAHLRPRRIQVFDSPQKALDTMLHEPPNLILTDWMRRPLSGSQFLRTIRDRHMQPLCFTPVIVVTAHATRATVERAMKAGVHMVLVKPVAPALLAERVRHITADSRRFELAADGTRFEIEGVQAKIAAQQARTEALNQVRSVRAAKAEPAILPELEPAPAKPRKWVLATAVDAPATPPTRNRRDVRTDGFARVRQS